MTLRTHIYHIMISQHVKTGASPTVRKLRRRRQRVGASQGGGAVANSFPELGMVITVDVPFNVEIKEHNIFASSPVFHR